MKARDAPSRGHLLGREKVDGAVKPPYDGEEAAVLLQAARLRPPAWPRCQDGIADFANGRWRAITPIHLRLTNSIFDEAPIATKIIVRVATILDDLDALKTDEPPSPHTWTTRPGVAWRWRWYRHLDPSSGFPFEDVVCLVAGSCRIVRGRWRLGLAGAGAVPE